MTFQRYSISVGILAAAALVSPPQQCEAFGVARPAIASRPCIHDCRTTSEQGYVSRWNSMLSAEVVNGGTGSINSKKGDPPRPPKDEKSNEDDESWQSATLRRIAELTLKDYEWRSSTYKSKEADRQVDDYLARMMGEDPSYVRPMDAGDQKIGPLVSFCLTPKHRALFIIWSLQLTKLPCLTL